MVLYLAGVEPEKWSGVSKIEEWMGCRACAASLLVLPVGLGAHGFCEVVWLFVVRVGEIGGDC